MPATAAALPQPGTDWRLIPALFARAGATAAAEEWLRAQGGDAGGSADVV